MLEIETSEDFAGAKQKPYNAVCVTSGFLQVQCLIFKLGIVFSEKNFKCPGGWIVLCDYFYLNAPFMG